MLLIGDIGGTKVNLAIYDVEDGKPKLEQEATFKSANYDSLEAVAQNFLTETHTNVSKAVFGVAGPVSHGQSHVTNLPWTISEESLSHTLHIPAVKLLNDLEATAYAVPHLSGHEVHALNRDQADERPHGHKAVIAPGTGLGEAILFYNLGEYHVVPSEGGHASFAPTNAVQVGLLNYLLQRFSHVSYERVCSGSMGIPNIYSYLSESRANDANPVVAEAIKEASDPTPVIVRAATLGECELCIAVLNIFTTILGNEAGNMAVKIMATGGIYLGGGIPPRIIEKLKDGTFMAAFVNKGRFANLLSHIPVYVILNDKAALLGSAYYGLYKM